MCERRRNPQPTPRAPLGSLQVSAFLDRFDTDLVCGLPVTDQGSFRYVLTCTDAFTRFMWAIPVRDQEAETIVKALMDHVSSAFGIPKGIHSDLGRNLTGNVMKLFCSPLGISQSTTTAYHPQGNAYSESGHQFLIDSVAKLSADHPRRRCDYLPAAVLTCNSNVNKSTGLSPYECVFRRPPTLPVDVAFGGARAPADPSPAVPADMLTYVCGLQQTLEKTDAMASDASVAAHQESKTAHDAHILEHVYTPGDRVWMRREAIKRGESRKLASAWHGPLQDMGKTPQLDLQSSEGGRIQRVCCAPQSLNTRTGGGSENHTFWRGGGHIMPPSISAPMRANATNFGGLSRAIL